jgi:hypothetical protein
VTHPHRHGRARPGHPRLLMWNGLEDVDARNKCGHDESEILAVGIRTIVGASPLTRFAVQIDLSRSGEVYRTCGSTDSTKSHPALASFPSSRVNAGARDVQADRRLQGCFGSSVALGHFAAVEILDQFKAGLH